MEDNSKLAEKVREVQETLRHLRKGLEAKSVSIEALKSQLETLQAGSHTMFAAVAIFHACSNYTPPMIVISWKTAPLYISGWSLKKLSEHYEERDTDARRLFKLV